jgi:hypothetical protein
VAANWLPWLHAEKYWLPAKNEGPEPWGLFSLEPLILLWCGREDLNLHEIAPASTSNYLQAVRSGVQRPKSLICRMGPFHRGPYRSGA